MPGTRGFALLLAGLLATPGGLAAATLGSASYEIVGSSFSAGSGALTGASLSAPCAVVGEAGAVGASSGGSGTSLVAGFCAIAAAQQGLVDSDGDGVLDAIEDSGPNAGDANGDAMLDSLQGNVASLPAAAGGGQVGVDVSGGCATAQSVSVSTEAEAPEEDPFFLYLHGLVSLVAPCETATVTFTFHAVPSLGGPWRNYGPTLPGVPASASWYTFPGAVFGSALVGASTVATATLALSDNALGDDTGDDGTIVTTGGPATPSPPIPALPASARLVLVLALLFASSLWVSRAGAGRG